MLYFDIDGTFLNYDDAPKAALLNQNLENVLKAANFDFLACVSGWVDIFSEPVMKLPRLEDRKAAIYRLLKDLFPDKDWFLDKLILIPDTDKRGEYIDLNSNWYYIDDWADDFFQKVHSKTLYQQELNKRICCCNPHEDGKDVLDFLKIK